ncbi:hypothetical protein D3C85_1408760 [compost metagenome]
MEFPIYADWRERSAAECSTLLTATQTRQLLKIVAKEYGNTVQPYLKLRELLLEDGWTVVEKHGDRLFMRVLVTYGDIGKEDMERFVRHATVSGNWSFADWRNSQLKPQLNVVKG